MLWEVSICNAYSVLLCWEYALCVKVEDVFRSGNEKPGRVEVHFYPRNGKPGGDRAAFCSGNGFLGGDGIHSASGVAVCGAYSIRPYPDGRKFIRFWVCFYLMQKKIAIFSGIRVGAQQYTPHKRPRQWSSERKKGRGFYRSGRVQRHTPHKRSHRWSSGRKTDRE